MITHLKISNYALIEQLEIDFISGFITITGETGAGKSILMGALSLILGQRADTSVLLKKDQKCIVEGQFLVNERFRYFFDKNDLDFDKETLIRREILPGGKSRAFINDTPVNLGQLKEIGSQMVDIHSQHQNLRLNDHIYQLNVIDYVADNGDKLKAYSEVYGNYLSKRSEINEMREEFERIRGELEFYRYQFEELERAQLDAGEKDELESEVNQLEHAEDIKFSLVQSADKLTGERQVLEVLNETLQLQRKIRDMFPPARGFTERLESAYIELKDLANEMGAAAERLEYDPDKLQEKKERIDLIYSLLQKHKASDVGELIELRDQLNEKITAFTFSDETIKRLEDEASDLFDDLKNRASELHKARKKSGLHVEKEISHQLKQLGIPNATFVVRIESKNDPDINGADNIRFLFSANKQSVVEDISKVASGGEISRLMLCIKSLLSDYKGLPTLIFDEIDAGVSGETAEKMGSIMKEMSAGRQVIAITHLPQVASQGDEHFLVFKEDEAHSTVTRIRKLNHEERVVEIAKLLSGEKITDAAISNARELLRIS
ncbi:MAG: DNA repair protein RecN [Bacteroidales bacterium]|nr:DNA repair protein RecN [Bacteroidales bacterium]